MIVQEELVLQLDFQLRFAHLENLVVEDENMNVVSKRILNFLGGKKIEKEN